jgi:hypothetical protein
MANRIDLVELEFDDPPRKAKESRYEKREYEDLIILSFDNDDVEDESPPARKPCRKEKTEKKSKKIHKKHESKGKQD